MDDELEIENPVRAPDAKTYQEDVPEVLHEKPEPPPMSVDNILEALKQAQKFVLCDEELFAVANQLISGVQSMKVRQEINSKTKQCSI